MKIQRILLAPLMALCASTAFAQVDVVPGAKLRFKRTAQDRSTEVRALSQNGDTLRVSTTRGPATTLLISDTHLIEQSMGKQRGQGFLIGSLVGLGVFGLSALADGGGSDQPECQEGSFCDDVEDVATGLAVVTGAVIGGTIGLLAARERWQRLTPDAPRLSLGVTRRGQLTVGLSRSW